MERFDTLEKALALFEQAGCKGTENDCFVAFKDTAHAQSGFVGGMTYPYDGLLVNRTEKGLALIYLKYKKALFLKADVSNFDIREDPCQFIPYSEIQEITVKNSALLNKKNKRVIVKTADKKKHCLLVSVDEPKLPYHNDGFARFMAAYSK